MNSTGDLLKESTIESLTRHDRVKVDVVEKERWADVERWSDVEENDTETDVEEKDVERTGTEPRDDSSDFTFTERWSDVEEKDVPRWFDVERFQKEVAADGQKIVYTEQLYKTKLCTFWESNRCARGAKCKYAHGKEELQCAPNLEKTTMCKQMVTFGVCNNASCKFAHNVDELRATDLFLKTTMCYFQRHGTCSRGDKCRHAHTEDELRRYVSMSQERQISGSTTASEGPCQSPYKDPMIDGKHRRRAAREQRRARGGGQIQNSIPPVLMFAMPPVAANCVSLPEQNSPTVAYCASIPDQSSPTVAYFPIGSVQNNQSENQGFVCSKCGVVNHEHDAIFCKNCGSKRDETEITNQFAISFMPCGGAAAGMVPVMAFPEMISC